MFTPLRGQNSNFSTHFTVINLEAGLQNYPRGNNVPSTSDTVSFEKKSVDLVQKMSKTFVWNLIFFYFYQSLTTDNRRVADFHLHLSGPALTCVKFVRHPCKRTWFAVKNAFTEQ